MDENMNEIKLKQKNKGCQNLVKAISFMVVFAILLSVTSRIVTPKSNRDLKQYYAAGFYGEPEDSIDYMLLGDSNSAEGFSPLEVWKKYGYSGYVCGEPFQTTSGIYHLLKEVLTCQSPKLVIIETNVFYALSEKFNLLSKNDEMTDVEKAINNEMSSSFPVVRYHNRWKTLTSNDFISVTDYNWKHVNKGYSFNKIQKPFAATDYMEASNNIEEINRTTEFYLYKIMSLCKKNNIDILFLSIPCPTSWNSIRHNAVENFANNCNVQFVDLNESISDVAIDWSTDLRDDIHLNYSGAKKVSQYFADYLNQNYQFTDHRSDESYIGWNEDLQTYEATVAG